MEAHQLCLSEIATLARQLLTTPPKSGSSSRMGHRAIASIPHKVGGAAFGARVAPPTPTPISGRIRIPELGIHLDSEGCGAIVKRVGLAESQQPLCPSPTL